MNYTKTYLFLFSALFFSVNKPHDTKNESLFIEMKKAVQILKKISPQKLNNLTQPYLIEKIEQLIKMQTEIEQPIEFHKNNHKEHDLHDFCEIQFSKEYTALITRKKTIINALWPIYKKDIETILKK